jgi:hypothetical protein
MSYDSIVQKRKPSGAWIVAIAFIVLGLIIDAATTAKIVFFIGLAFLLLMSLSLA